MGSAVPVVSLSEVSFGKSTGMTNGSASSFIGEELKHVSFSLDVHRSVFKQVVLTNKLGIREHVNAVIGNQIAFDRNDPTAIQ